MKVIEFAGMPRAGKTTAIEVMESLMKKDGAKVRLIYEGARISPLDKSDRYNYNAWSFHNTINRVLEARLDNYDFILIDRGVFDHVAFLKAIESQCAGRDMISTEKYYLNFLNLQDQEILFTVDVEEAIRRERKNKPVLGRVFEHDFLDNLSRAYYETANLFEVTKKREAIKLDGNGKLEDNIQRIVSLTKKFMNLKGDSSNPETMYKV